MSDRQLVLHRKRNLGFVDLSADVKALIVQYISRPTDLKSLCLVNKHMHGVAVRRLYHHVTLEVGSPLDPHLADFISPSNIGLEHIRKLDLYLADVLDKCNQSQQAHLAVRVIITLLPEDILEEFRWHPWDAFSADNLQLLYKKQRRMQWLESIPLDRYNALQEMQQWSDWNAEGFFKHVRRLGLYPDSVAGLNMCAALLQRSEKVEKITLHVGFVHDESRWGGATRGLNDTSVGAGLVTSTIFGHMLPFNKCRPLVLSDLTLQKIHLIYAAETYCKVIDFNSLRDLRVIECAGTESLFAELSKSQRLPDKLETLEVKHEDNLSNDLLNALNGFVCLVSGIRALTVDICYSEALPASEGIVRHFKTLKKLNVHASRGDGHEEELVYDHEDFDKICSTCTEIEQLSCAFPQTSIVRTLSDPFAAFDLALESLPNLTTLNITTWPTSASSNSRLPRKIYETLLQSIAKGIFDRASNASMLIDAQIPPPAPTDDRLHALRKLKIVTFGASGNGLDNLDDSDNLITYVRGRGTDLYGADLGPLAVRTGMCMSKYIEPTSDVLDFSLSRGVRRPPTIEDGRGEYDE